MSSTLIPLLVLAPQLASVEGAHAPRVPIEVNTLAATDPKLSAFAPAPPDPARVHYTQPSDVDNADDQPQVIWARGAQYKASFGADGATYFPIFGARSTKHHPIAFSPSSVTLGGEPLAYEAHALAARANDHIAIERGAFVETYDLQAGSIEQSFHFATLPGAGELVVTIPLDTDLSIEKRGAGVELSNELGHVTYSGAVAIDARGTRRDADLRLIDGSIELVVDADFVAHAALPLTLDPLISTFTVDGSTNRKFRAPDVAYDPDTRTWLVVYQELVANEYDVLYAYYRDDPTTGPIGSGFVDMSSNSWEHISCANNRAARQFVVVSDVRIPLVSIDIVGRFLRPPNSTAPQILRTLVSLTTSIAHTPTPVVGGDPSATGPTTYCVAYAPLAGGGQVDLDALLVGTDGVVQAGSPFHVISQVNEAHELPAISRSNDGNEWTLAWQRSLTSTQPLAIWSARVSSAGTISEAPHSIATTSAPATLTRAAVSSAIPGTRINAVAWQRYDGVSATDVWTNVLNADPASNGQFNHAFLLAGAGTTMFPAVEYDGSKFQFVCVRALGADFGTLDDFPVFPGFAPPFPQGALIWQNSEFVVSAGSSLRTRPRVACPVVAGADSSYVHRALVVSAEYATSAGATGPATIQGAVTETESGGFQTNYCVGDGNDGACPCGNNGALGHGCANSVNPAGALLDATGVNGMLSDTFVLHVTGLPQTTTCWFFQQNLVDGITFPFGDGLRCGAGPIVRLKTKAAVAGAVNYPDVGEVPLSIRGQLGALGAMVAYQVSYRNAQSFCTPETINITNGILAVWTP